MALSDQLSELSTQAKALEDSAASIHAENKAKAEARIAELRASLDAAKVSVDSKLDADADEIDTAWAQMQRSVSDSFASLKADADARRTHRKATHADRAADSAELDAQDAIDFAIQALQEAEYFVLTAAVAREDADEAEAADIER
ncbi:hypothetical protein [Subtercola sp. YIM 133946]|uniref:hypothetical protein n=1 Tax=Subtercola sp. YIM 133946 TaxID=3118909 RepID=UPI002F92535F